VAEERRCPRCGAVLPTRGPETTPCTRCLLALGLSEGVAGDPPPSSSDDGETGDGSRRVGPYRVVDTVGAGPAGDVHLAEDEGPARRRVALKVVRAAKDAGAALARFEALRPTLARLTHPGLAKVLDAGMTDEGWPCFVMEWVRGVPITEHCDRERLTIPRRLELFLEVCGAIEHAHAAGVCHGSLKPSNVLVTEENGGSRPKVLDLGVARLSGRRLSSESLYSARDLLSGTPCYVPPEQTPPAHSDPLVATAAAHRHPSDVDARTDVYSLGVLLYELVAGTAPFEPHRLRGAGRQEMARIIREETPPPPSERVGGLAGDVAAEVAVRRRTEPRRLTKDLAGALDAIVLTTLAKDPAGRYPSVRELAADVRRHMRHEPVSVRPGWRARLRRAVRRMLGPTHD
jgi:serine/threonine protein kinase